MQEYCTPIMYQVKVTRFEGHLQVKGSRIRGFDSCREKTLTDLKLLDRLYKGGNIIIHDSWMRFQEAKRKTETI